MNKDVGGASVLIQASFAEGGALTSPMTRDSVQSGVDKSAVIYQSVGISVLAQPFPALSYAVSTGWAYPVESNVQSRVASAKNRALSVLRSIEAKAAYAGALVSLLAGAVAASRGEWLLAGLLWVPFIAVLLLTAPLVLGIWLLKDSTELFANTPMRSVSTPLVVSNVQMD